MTERAKQRRNVWPNALSSVGMYDRCLDQRAKQRRNARGDRLNEATGARIGNQKIVVRALLGPWAYSSQNSYKQHPPSTSKQHPNISPPPLKILEQTLQTTNNNNIQLWIRRCCARWLNPHAIDRISESDAALQRARRQSWIGWRHRQVT